MDFYIGRTDVGCSKCSHAWLKVVNDEEGNRYTVCEKCGNKEKVKN